MNRSCTQPRRNTPSAYCASLATGPRFVVGSRKSPTFCRSSTAFAIALVSSCPSASTSMCVGALHVWPLLNMTLSMPLVTACRKSTSGNRILRDLPPTSYDICFTVQAADCATRTPARVDPGEGHHIDIGMPTTSLRLRHLPAAC